MTQRNRRSLWLLVLLVLLLGAQLAMLQFGPDATAQAVATTDTSGEPARVEGAGTGDASTHPALAEGSGAAGTEGSGGSATSDDAGASTQAARVRSATTRDGAVDPLATRTSFERRAGTVSLQAATRTDSRLAAIARRVDAEVATAGSKGVAARLAARFGMTVEELRAEKAATGASWGQLMIAHALAANSSMTVEQLLDMHAGGMGWGRIAAGLGLKLGAAVRGVNASAHAVQGSAKAGGHMAAARGARAHGGVRGGMSGGLVASNARAGVGAGVGAGLKLGH